MGTGRLPVAPRPYRDELLSSWMARVACRYGLTAQQLGGSLAAKGSGLSPVPIDDRAPSADQTRVWARACGIDPQRLQRLALSRRYPRRPEAWFASQGPEWAPSATSRSLPVCLACFAADHAVGRDAYLRADCILAERCICPIHRQPLQDRCLACQRRLSVAFRLLDRHARPACRYCGMLLADRGGEGGRPHDRKLVLRALAVQQRITASVNAEDPERERFEKALATLWAPLDRPSAARPVLALWFNEEGWRCPYEVRHAVGTRAPLGQLPARWRFLTLLALIDVFGVHPDEDGAIPAAALRMTCRAAPRRSRILTSPLRRKAADPLLRSAAEYERLARQILSDPGWIATQHLPERKRDRVRARLIDAALSRSLESTARPMPDDDVAGRKNRATQKAVERV